MNPDRNEAARWCEAPPVAWSVAGSDSGAGAGLQADLRAFAAFGVHGCSAVAALTAQNSVAVERVEAVSPAMLEAQLSALASDLPPAAIKVGLLGSVDNLRMLVRWIDRLRASAPVALVVDPVLRASTGARLADEQLLRAHLDELLPRATLLTPNAAEVAALLGVPAPRGRPVHPSHKAGVLAPGEAGALEALAVALAERTGAAVAVTGGDLGDTRTGRSASSLAFDYAVTPQARGWLSLPRIDTPHRHGTGCVFAASAAAALALGHCAMDAVVLAKMATAQGLREAWPAGRGAGPVRPQPGFAQRIDNLPALHAQPSGPSAPFPGLDPQDLGLYAIVDAAERVERVLAAGARAVQLRIKDPAAPGLSEQIARSAAAARAAGAQLYVNDHWQLAIAHQAWGVHLGQEDLASADLDAIRRAGLRLGISTHAYWEVCRAWALRPSYVACGPVHPTASKAMPWIPQGEGNLAYWSRLMPVPVVGIAGMDGQRVRRALQCGAAGAVVMRAINAAPDPDRVVAALQAEVEAGRRGPPLPGPSIARPTLAGPVFAGSASLRSSARPSASAGSGCAARA